MSELLNYNLITPGPIRFGWGRRREAGQAGAALGRRAMIICGSRTLAASPMLGEVESSLAAAGVEPHRLITISHEPRVDDVGEAVRLLLSKQAGSGDFLLAIGGGAAIDLAKASAAMCTQEASQDIRDYLEGVGRELPLERDPLLIMALPTTGGTGSEATKNAVISSNHPPYKKSLRSERLLPRAVIVDPELAVSLPPAATSQAGMDAITQLIESFISRRAQPVTDALCLAALPGAIDALPVAFADGANRQAREALAHAALMSGVALANSGLGVAHAVAAALGIHAGVPHGLACAVMLPAALAVNRPVCEAKLAIIGQRITGRTYSDRSAAADATIEQIDRLSQTLKIPRGLSELGVRREQLPALVQGSHGNSLNGNPRGLSDDELYHLLEQML